MANLTAEYQANIRAALADNDYKKAQALLDEYNNGYQRDLKNAQILAEFGDFSAFANLYGADQAKNMEAVWRAQNPVLAASLDYAAGKIDADQYYQLTGTYPAGYIPAGGLGGGGGGVSDWTGYGSGVPIDYTPSRYPGIANEIYHNNGSIDDKTYTDARNALFS